MGGRDGAEGRGVRTTFYSPSKFPPYTQALEKQICLGHKNTVYFHLWCSMLKVCMQQVDPTPSIQNSEAGLKVSCILFSYLTKHGVPLTGLLVLGWSRLSFLSFSQELQGLEVYLKRKTRFLCNYLIPGAGAFNKTVIIARSMISMSWSTDKQHLKGV